MARHTTRIKYNTDNRDISIIIIGSYPTKRGKSLGPQSTFRINEDKSLLERQLELLLKKFPNADILLSVGFQSELAIKRAPDNIRIIENQLYEDTNDVEDLRLAINNSTNDRALLLYADLLFNRQTISKITEKGSGVVLSSDDENPIGCTTVENYITVLSYGLKEKWAGITFLDKKEFNIVKDLVNDKSKSKMFLFEILNMLLEQGGKLYGYKNKGQQILKINNSKKLYEDALFIS